MSENTLVRAGHIANFLHFTEISKLFTGKIARDSNQYFQRDGKAFAASGSNRISGTTLGRHRSPVLEIDSARLLVRWEHQQQQSAREEGAWTVRMGMWKSP